MRQSKGIVSKIKNDYWIVLTPDGDFVKIKAPREPARVGEEIVFSLPIQKNWLYYGSLVASLLILVMGLGIYQQLSVNRPVAYVALDINPSIEMAVNDTGLVVDITGINQDGRNLLQNLNWQKHPLDEVLKTIVTRAKEENFIKENMENVMVVSVTKLNIKESVTTNIDTKLTKAVAETKTKVKVISYNTTTIQYEEAKKQHISAGKLMVYKEAREHGDSVSLDDIRNQSITQLTRKGVISSVDGTNSKVSKKDVIMVEGTQKKKIKLIPSEVIKEINRKHHKKGNSSPKNIKQKDNDITIITDDNDDDSVTKTKHQDNRNKNNKDKSELTKGKEQENDKDIDTPRDRDINRNNVKDKDRTKYQDEAKDKDTDLKKDKDRDRANNKNQDQYQYRDKNQKKYKDRDKLKDKTKEKDNSKNKYEDE